MTDQTTATTAQQAAPAAAPTTTVPEVALQTSFGWGKKLGLFSLGAAVGVAGKMVYDKYIAA